MSYAILADLIERHKRALAVETIPPAIELKVIDDSQIDVDIEGFMYSFQVIADSIRAGDLEIWSKFVEQVALNQLARGVSHRQSINLGDYMFGFIDTIIEREVVGADKAELRDRFHRRLQGMHSLGKITVVTAQLKQDLKKA